MVFFIFNSTQITKIDNESSSLLSVSIRVPQGSILGPLLFLIYVNDLPLVLITCEVALYAYDTVIFTSGTTASEIETKLNSDLEKVNFWFSNNQLSLNISKSKFLLIGGPHKLKAIKDMSLVINDN